MRHRASPLAAAAMGRLLTASILLSSDFKDSFRLTVEVNGGGPLGRVTAEVRTGGKVRVRTEHSEVDLPLRPDGKLAVGQAVGRTGYFRVLREDAFSHRYEGQVELATGEIGDDLMRYYLQSEQIPSAVALGVLVGPDGVVQGAGGVVVQALPGCPESRSDSPYYRKFRIVFRRATPLSLSYPMCWEGPSVRTRPNRLSFYANAVRLAA